MTSPTDSSPDDYNKNSRFELCALQDKSTLQLFDGEKDSSSIEALASWLFDRELFQGASFTSGRTDVVEFDPGPALSLQLLWRR